MRTLKTLTALTAMTLMLFAFTGCSDDDDPTGPSGTTPADEFEVVRTAAEDFLAGPTAITTSIALNDLLTNSSAADDPYVLSVRSTDHYNIGHIPGAVNMPWKTVADPTNLAALPTGTPIVAYCYTGHTGQVATTVLGVMGYDVKNMKFGMLSWSKDAAVRATTPYSTPVDVRPIETTANVPTMTYDLPTIETTTSNDSDDILQAVAAGFLATASPVTTASAVVNAGLENYFIVSVRSADHYALGHIPGAINIPWKQIATVENLQKLPTDEKILVYCYTGHTGQIATTVLNLLGYDAVNLKYGMSGWSGDDQYMGGVERFDEGAWPDLDTQP